MFAEFTGAYAGPHLDVLRAWVRDGAATLSADDARAAVPDLSDDEVRARLHFRIATEACRRGDDDVARRHFVRAGELAPTDFTIRRAAMPLMGGDPVRAGIHGALPGVGAARQPVPRAPTDDRLSPPATPAPPPVPRLSAPTGVVGRPRLRNSATRASTARTESDARRPSRRASAFSSTIASAVFGGTPASSSAASRSASEMNGTPLVSSVCAFDVRSFGHRRVALDAGEERRGERGDQDRAGERGADRDARGWRRCSGGRRPRRSARRAPRRR